MVLLNKNINAEKNIYSLLCIGLVYSMIFLTYLNSIFAILLTVYWLFFSKKNFDFSTQKTRLMFLFISLYLVGIAGMLYTNNTIAGIATLKTQSAILFFPIVFGTTSVLDTSLLKTITTHFLIATGLASITGIGYGMYNYIRTDNIDQVAGINILLFHGFRPVTMSLYCLLAIVIAFEKSYTSSRNAKRYLYIFVILMSLMIFLLSVRLVMFCWFLVMLYYAIKIFQQRSHRILLVAGSILTLVISAFAIPSARKQWNEFFDFSAKSTIVLDQDSSLGKSWGGKALRIAIWKCSADILNEHWLTGVGTGDVQDSLQKAYEKRKFYFASMYNRYNAHNEYLQITLANGLTGLLILLSCIFYPLLHYNKNFSGNTYLLFLMLFALVGFSESLLEVNKGIIWYSFFNSIFAFGYLKSDKT